MDLWHKITKWMDYNRGLMVGLIVALIIGVGLLGCQVRTDSLVEPGTRVTPQQFDAEVTIARADLIKRQASLEADNAALNARAEAGAADIAGQIERRKAIVEGAAGLGQAAVEGTLSPASAIGTLTQLVLLGATGGLFYDNRKKDRLIVAKDQPVDLTPAGEAVLKT